MPACGGPLRVPLPDDGRTDMGGLNLLGMNSIPAPLPPGDPERDELSPASAPVVNPRTEPGDVWAPPRLLDRLREAIRVRHYSIRTEVPIRLGAA